MNRRFAFVPVATVAGAAIAVGAGFAAGAASSPASSRAAASHASALVQPALVKPFAAYGDKALYDLVPGGNFTPKTADWSLTGEAALVANHDLAAQTGSHALSLTSGASATSASFPGGDVHTVRLFVQNMGSSSSNLKVSATVTENGVPTQVQIGTVQGSSLAPSPILTLPKALQTQLTESDAPLKLTISSTGQNSHWLVKDVYVDPYTRCC
jgi:hypothetical protein